MLVLTRKLMEKLYIGDDVCVTVVRLEGGQVRLGIDAPREVAVVRAELTPERGRAGGRSEPRTPHTNANADADTARDANRPPVTVARGGSERRASRSR